MNKFKAGDKILVRKYNSNGIIMPRWIDDMDYLDGQVVVVDCMPSIGVIMTTYGWLLNTDWCEKIEDGVPDDHIESNETLEQKEYDFYMTLIRKCIDQIIGVDEISINNYKGTIKRVISEFKKGDKVFDSIDDINWESRRYEMAKDFMAAQIGGYISKGLQWDDKMCVANAVHYADKLIKELKLKNKDYEI